MLMCGQICVRQFLDFDSELEIHRCLLFWVSLMFMVKCGEFYRGYEASLIFGLEEIDTRVTCSMCVSYCMCLV